MLHGLQVMYPRCWRGRDVYGSTSCAGRVYCSVGIPAPCQHRSDRASLGGAPRQGGGITGAVTSSGGTTTRDVKCGCPKNSFWMFDKSNKRFKLTSQPPLCPSGLLCHVTLRRSALDAITASISGS